MNDTVDQGPDSTAARVALWRALHVECDAPPHVLADEVGLQLLAPGPDWQQRGDMDPQFTRPFRASIVARGTSGTQRCEIRTVTALTPEEVQALPARDRP